MPGGGGGGSHARSRVQQTLAQAGTLETREDCRNERLREEQKGKEAQGAHTVPRVSQAPCLPARSTGALPELRAKACGAGWATLLPAKHPGQPTLLGVASTLALEWPSPTPSMTSVNFLLKKAPVPAKTEGARPAQGLVGHQPSSLAPPECCTLFTQHASSRGSSYPHFSCRRAIWPCVQGHMASW